MNVVKNQVIILQQLNTNFVLNSKQTGKPLHHKGTYSAVVHCGTTLCYMM